MKWATFLLILTILACKNKKTVCLIDASDILKGATKKITIIKDSGYKISAIYDEGWDSLKGGVYLFYPNQFLKSYTFYQAKLPVYSEEYDQNGYLIQTKGSPMVARIINDMGQDSAFVQVYFFKTMKTYQELNIKINNSAPVNYALENDTVFSNMKSVTFGITTTDQNRINMYSRIKYLDDCSKAEHILSDSLFLVKDSQTGLSPASAK
jgi:hypothetical protein